MRRILAPLLLLAVPALVLGQEAELPPVVVTALPPPPAAASALDVTAGQLAARPIARPGEMLEAAPGLITTQHSGEGKANQYFLRGFNLDHGTDLAIQVDGMVSLQHVTYTREYNSVVNNIAKCDYS